MRLNKVLPGIFICIYMALSVPAVLFAGNLSQTQISQLYVALFGRASEGEGNFYWQSMDKSLEETVRLMLDTAPAQDYFGNTLYDNRLFIEFIYLNTLGKTYAEDPEGVDYWISRLEAGSAKETVVADLVRAIMFSQYSGTASQERFINRVEVSNYTAESIYYISVDEIQSFVDFIDNVTYDAADVTQAKDEVDLFIRNGDGVTYYRDSDNDGFGDPSSPYTSHARVDGYVVNNLDCNDYNDAIHPYTVEIENDGIDQDCDGVDLVVYEDDEDYGDDDFDGNGDVSTLYGVWTVLIQGYDASTYRAVVTLNSNRQLYFREYVYDQLYYTGGGDWDYNEQSWYFVANAEDSYINDPITISGNTFSVSGLYDGYPVTFEWIKQ